MLSTDHADVVEHYRAAHDAHARHMQSGAADTEDLRQAFVHYRSLYGALTGTVAEADVRRPGDDATHTPYVVDVRDGAAPSGSTSSLKS